MEPFSWILAAVGIFGIYLAGKKHKAGWAVGLGAQVLWIVFAIATQQWGFIASALAYGFIYGKNYLAWRRESQEDNNGLRVRPERVSGS